MATRSLEPVCKPRVLASTSDCALVSTFVPGLRNTLLVQLHRQNYGRSARWSLYAVYREASMTFDAIIGIEADDDSVAPADLLSRFIDDAEFEWAVLRPLRAKVRRHFAR